MDGASKKKRFVYNKPSSEQRKNTLNADFPDDLNLLLSQPAYKKIKLSNGKPKESAPTQAKNDNQSNNSAATLGKSKSVLTKKSNNAQQFTSISAPSANSDKKQVDEIDFGDDFDFLDAADELEQIEIAATQQFAPKPDNKDDVIKPKNNYVNSESDSVLDELLDENFGCEIKKQVCNAPLVHPNKLSLRLPENTGTHASSLPKNPLLVPFKARNFVESPKKVENLTEHAIELSQAKTDLSEIKIKLNAAHNEFLSKDGEIKILRESMKKLSEQESKSKEMVHNLEKQLKTQQSEKESQLLQEVERLKTQLDFKRKETVDMQEKNRKLIAQMENSKKQPESLRSPQQTNFTVDGFKPSPARPSTSKTKCPSSKPVCHTRANRRSENNFQMTSSVLATIKSWQARHQNLRIGCQHPSDSVKKSAFRMFDLQYELTLLEMHNLLIQRTLTKLKTSLYEFKSLVDAKTFVDVSKNQKGESSLCCDCDVRYRDCLNSMFLLAKLCLFDKSLSAYMADSLAGEDTRNKLLKSTTPKIRISLDNQPLFKKYRDSSVLIQNVRAEEKATCEKDYWLGKEIWQLLRWMNQLDQHIFVDLKEVLLVFYSKLTLLQGHNKSLGVFLQKERILEVQSNTSAEETIALCVELFQNCVTNPNIYQLICSHNDQCPLSWICQNITINESNVFEKWVVFISSLISVEPSKSLTSLLDNSCRCAKDVIETLVTRSFVKFKKLQHKVNNEAELSQEIREELWSFRKALCLLCALCTGDKNLMARHSTVEWRYIYLLGGAINILRALPYVSDSEVTGLEDLLDMEQYSDLSEDNGPMEEN